MVAILPPIAASCRRRQSDHDPLCRRCRRDESPQLLGRAEHRAPGWRAAAELARVDSGQLPGARVRAPPLWADRRAGRRRAALGADRQGDVAGARRGRGPSRRSYGSSLRPRSGQRSSIPRAASSTAPVICLRVEGHEGDRTPSRCAAPPAADARPASRRRPAARERVRRRRLRHLVDHPVELGRFWRGRFDAAGSSTNSSSPAPCPTRRRAPARRHQAAVRGRDRLWHGSGPAPFDSYFSCSRARGRSRRPRQRSALPRRAAARPAAPGPGRRRQGGAGESRNERRVRRRAGLIAHEYFHAWNVSASGRASLDLRLRRRELHPAALVLRRLSPRLLRTCSSCAPA